MTSSRTTSGADTGALAAFVRARLDEDEAVAKAATDGPWHVDGGSEVRGRARDYAGGEPGILVVRHTWAPEAAHIARHDPSRVLREVQAKRAILDLYEASLTYSNAEDEGRSWLLAEVVRHFAAVYADHPDYDEAWRP